MADVARKAIISIGDPAKVMMKMQILDWKSYEVVPKDEADQVLTEILNQGQVSLAFVPYIDSFPLASLKGKWNPSSNAPNSITPIPTPNNK